MGTLLLNKAAMIRDTKRTNDNCAGCAASCYGSVSLTNYLMRHSHVAREHIKWRTALTAKYWGCSLLQKPRDRLGEFTPTILCSQTTAQGRENLIHPGCHDLQIGLVEGERYLANDQGFESASRKRV